MACFCTALRNVLTIGLLFAFPVVSCAGDEEGSVVPNIIFIMVDDMGYHDLGCYGSKTIFTPNLDRLAAEGMRFTDCYAGDTVCASSRSTLMTGTHKGHTPVRGNSGGIPLFPEDVTVAEVLKKAGYTTGGFGRRACRIDTTGRESPGRGILSGGSLCGPSEVA